MVSHAVRIPAAALAVLISFAAPRASGQEAGEVFTALGCGACHGEEGGGNALGPNIATRELTTTAFIDYVRNPTGTMLAYSADTVSDQSLTEMYANLTPVYFAELLGRVARGAELYRQTGCYQCHADEGQGGAQGPRVGPDPLTLSRFTWYIRNPSGGMPPYTDVVMTDQDVADIHAFLKAQPQPPALESIPLLAP